MKKLLVLLGIILALGTPVFAQNTEGSELTTNDVVLFTQNERWGLKDKTDKITVEPIYRKMIRVGTHSWIVQNKKQIRAN